MISLSNVAADIERLQPIPAAGIKLAQAVADGNGSLLEMVKIIEYDPVLTTSTLRLANSAFYAATMKISSARDAVQRLGVGRILQFVVGHYAHDRLQDSLPGYDMPERELWRHSVAAAVAVDLLPMFSKRLAPAVSFTGALLHDLGKLVLSRYLQEDVKQQILLCAATEQVSYVEAERKILGVDHAQIGAVIARRWAFPEMLVECIQRHHHPSAEESNPALDAVHIGNTVAKLIGIGLGSEQLNVEAVATSADAFRLTPAKLDALCAATLDELESVLSLYEEV